MRPLASRVCRRESRISIIRYAIQKIYHETYTNEADKNSVNIVQSAASCRPDKFRTRFRNCIKVHPTELSDALMIWIQASRRTDLIEVADKYNFNRSRGSTPWSSPEMVIPALSSQRCPSLNNQLFERNSRKTKQRASAFRVSFVTPSDRATLGWEAENDG